jgi:hypothetical protein
VLLVCTVYSVLYSEITLSQKPFGIGHMYIYSFLLRMTDDMTQSIDLSSWDTLYICSRVEMTLHVCCTRWFYVVLVEAVGGFVKSTPSIFSCLFHENAHFRAFLSIMIEKR